MYPFQSPSGDYMQTLVSSNSLKRFGIIFCFYLFLNINSVVAQELQFKSNLPIYTSRRTPVVEVFQRVKGAVVNIHSERTTASLSTSDRFSHASQTQRINGMGTGIIIDPRGYIITNHHVVDDVQLLRIRLVDGTSHNAKVVARDPENDLALLKIDTPKPLQIIPLGTASDLMEGEQVIAIGNAFGYEHTLSTGIISALKRDVNLNREVSYKSLIQTDASINPGNSGGPLLNIHGELIGVNVAIRAGAQGIGFAIPVDTMLNSAQQLLNIRRRNGMTHGILAHNVIECQDGLCVRSVRVDRVLPDSPGQKSGIQNGDVIRKIGNFPIHTTLDMERAFLDRPLNEKIVVMLDRDHKKEPGRDKLTSVVKDKKSITVELTLAPLDKSAVKNAIDMSWQRIGLRVTPVNASKVTNVNPQLHGGLAIEEIREGSPADKAGFQRGDILIGLHQWETVSLDNVSFVLTHPDLSSFIPLKFFLIRKGQLHNGWLNNLEP